MNKLVLTTFVAALSGVFAAPKMAHAGGDEVAAAIGGFIGGVIVGSSMDDDDGRDYDRRGVHVGTRIEISSGRDHHRGRYGHDHRHGYWDWTRVRVWVPGRWVVSYDHCGNRVRHFERGHHEWRRERVWVSTHGHRRREYDDCR
jgi:hypothetical protein